MIGITKRPIESPIERSGWAIAGRDGEQGRRRKRVESYYLRYCGFPRHRFALLGLVEAASFPPTIMRAFASTFPTLDPGIHAGAMAVLARCGEIFAHSLLCLWARAAYGIIALFHC